MSEDRKSPSDMIIQILKEHAASAEPTDSTSKPESYMSVDEQGNPVESLVIRNPNELRKVVSLHIDWVPAMGYTVDELQAMNADDQVPEGAQINIPAMILGSLPMHPKMEGAIDEMQHNVFVLDDAQMATHLVAMGINLFTRDMEATNKIMGLIAYLMSDEDDDDDEPTFGPHGINCKCEGGHEGEPDASIELDPMTAEQLAEFMTGLGEILTDAQPGNIEEVGRRMRERAKEIKNKDTSSAVDKAVADALDKDPGVAELRKEIEDRDENAG